MPLFRKKPVVIVAIQWTGENLSEVLEFTGKHPSWDKWFNSFEEYEAHVRADRSVFKIKTLEGTHEAAPGDWIIRGVHGEHYPCKPDIFAKTYEPASAALDKLIAEAVAAERDRVTRIAASLFPGGYDNNRIKIEDRLSEIAAKGAQT